MVLNVRKNPDSGSSASPSSPFLSVSCLSFAEERLLLRLSFCYSTWADGWERGPRHFLPDLSSLFNHRQHTKIPESWLTEETNSSAIGGLRFFPFFSSDPIAVSQSVEWVNIPAPEIPYPRPNLTFFHLLSFNRLPPITENHWLWLHTARCHYWNIRRHWFKR